MIVMIDNYDSFTYNLVRYFKELDEEVVVFRNDKVTDTIIENLNPDGIVISPGPKAPKDAKEVLHIIDKFKGSIPILGICLGHQCIGEYFGCNIVKGSKPMHGKISKVINNGQGIFKGLRKEFNVTRYHSLIINRETIKDELKVTAETEDGVVMGIENESMSIYGVQYHPEAVLTEEGHNLLKNFITICNEFKGEIDGF